MRYRDICRALAKYLFFVGCILFLPLGIALYDQFIAAENHPQPFSSLAFVKTIAITFLIAASFYQIGKRSSGHLYRREGIFLVAIIWFITGLVAGLPFYLSHTLNRPIDAYFEAISGLTTTGASVMCAKAYDKETGEEIARQKQSESLFAKQYSFYGTIEPVRDKVTGAILYEGVEAVSHALLFWRSFIQWLGGMGIVVLFIAVLPLLGVGGKMLYQSEVPGPIKDGLTPRIKETALGLWKIYLFLSGLEVVLLKVTNPDLSLFHAIVITFSTISTGGFTMTNGSIASYQNSMTEWITLCFMIVGSVNFTLYFYCVQKKWKKLFDGELIVYFIILALGSSCIVYQIRGMEKILLTGETGLFSFSDAVRYGLYHYISAQTSTGFATADYDVWPALAQFVLWVSMFIGGMAGSTGGGMKIIRHCVVFQMVKNQIYSLFRPRQVHALRVHQQDMDHKTGFSIFSFFILTLFCSIVGVFLFSCSGVDLETAFGLNACMLNNIGIAFRTAGPSDSFAFLSPFAKALSLTWMILGRLEYFALVILLFPAFWRGK